MKPVTLVDAVLGVLLGLGIADASTRGAGIEFHAYQMVSDAEFAVMREEAERIASERASSGVRFNAGIAGAKFFELSVGGKPAIVVDSSSEQLLIVVLASGRHDDNDLLLLQQTWRGRLQSETEVDGS